MAYEEEYLDKINSTYQEMLMRIGRSKNDQEKALSNES